MQALHALSLGIIAATWVVAWRLGFRWCHGCGVDERASRWALACVPPTAGLVFSVHLAALAALLSGKGLVTPASAAGIFVLLTWAAARSGLVPRGRAPLTASVPASAPTPLGPMRLPVLIVAATYCVFFVDALLRYPTGYDALYYHLPVAIGWTQERAMNLVLGSHYLSHPENGMIVTCLLAFAGLESLFPFVHFSKSLLTGAAVFGLARAVGVSRQAAWASACIALSVPMVLFQSFSGYIDLYGTAAWLVALLALTWVPRVERDDQRRGLLVISGLAAGVALGSKTTFLVHVALLAAVAVAVEWIRPRLGSADRRRPLRNAAIFGAAALACTTFWFVRGTIQAGNPLYPLDVSVGDTQLLRGVTADQVFPTRRLATKLQRWWDYPWTETKYSGTGYPYSVNNGLGAAYSAFVPLGMLAALLTPWRRMLARGPTRAQSWQLLVFLLSLGGIALLLTVFREMLRFVLPQLLLGVVVTAVLIDRLLARCPRTMHVVLSGTLAVSALVAVYPPAHSLLVRAKHNLWARAAYYGIPPLIDELEPGTRILNASDSMWNYPLLGRKLTNDVVDAGLWTQSLCPDGMNAKALYDNKVEYVFVREPWPTDWPDDLPVELVYDGAERQTGKLVSRREGMPPSRIYRVMPKHARSVTVPTSVTSSMSPG